MVYDAVVYTKCVKGYFFQNIFLVGANFKKFDKKFHMAEFELLLN